MCMCTCWVCVCVCVCASVSGRTKRFHKEHIDDDVPTTSWGFGFLSSETEAQTQSRHSFYMFEFRVRKCPLFRTHSCKHCKPFSCRYAHYENQTRRIPKLIGDTWSYDVQLCSANSLLECPQGLKCGFSHRLQKENIYHPLVYKTKTCEHPLISCGPALLGCSPTQAVDFFPPTSQEWFQCAEYGLHCAKAHGPQDLRVVPGAVDIEASSSALISETSSSSSSSSCSSSSSSSFGLDEKSGQLENRSENEAAFQIHVHAHRVPSHWILHKNSESTARPLGMCTM